MHKFLYSKAFLAAQQRGDGVNSVMILHCGPSRVRKCFMRPFGKSIWGPLIYVLQNAIFMSFALGFMLYFLGVGDKLAWYLACSSRCTPLDVQRSQRLEPERRTNPILWVPSTNGIAMRSQSWHRGVHPE
jgi:hypothetical protein